MRPHVPLALFAMFRRAPPLGAFVSISIALFATTNVEKRDSLGFRANTNSLMCGVSLIGTKLRRDFHLCRYVFICLWLILLEALCGMYLDQNTFVNQYINRLVGRWGRTPPRLVEALRDRDLRRRPRALASAPGVSTDVSSLWSEAQCGKIAVKESSAFKRINLHISVKL